MSCEHYKDALAEAAASGAELADAPVSDLGVNALRSHLESCASCRAAFAEEQSLFSAINSGLHTKANAEVPVTLLPRVRASLEDAVAPRSRWMQPPVVAFTGVALAFLLLLFVRSHGLVPNNVAKQTPATPTPMVSTAGTQKDISPSSVQVASTTLNHLHMPRTSTVMRSAASSNPEVLVPPDEREGLARLVATLNGHRDFAVAFLSQHSERKDTLVTVDPLQISDIEIKPLEGAERNFGWHGRETLTNGCIEMKNPWRNE